jgi:hypothetical protein
VGWGGGGQKISRKEEHWGWDTVVLPIRRRVGGGGEGSTGFPGRKNTARRDFVDFPARGSAGRRSRGFSRKAKNLGRDFEDFPVRRKLEALIAKCLRSALSMEDIQIIFSPL